jgi:hypothetical protein
VQVKAGAKLLPNQTLNKANYQKIKRKVLIIYKLPIKQQNLWKQSKVDLVNLPDSSKQVANTVPYQNRAQVLMARAAMRRRLIRAKWMIKRHQKKMMMETPSQLARRKLQERATQMGQNQMSMMSWIQTTSILKMRLRTLCWRNRQRSLNNLKNLKVS